MSRRGWMAAGVMVLVFVAAWVAADAAAADAAAADAAPGRFRDFTVYTRSAPDAADANRIVATMRLLNRGATPLDVRVSLGASPAAGFAGKEFDARIEAGREASVTFDLKPPDGLKREVLKGSISFGAAAGGEPDRELFVAVQGPDPAGFDNKRVTKITAKAEVVGTFAPRTVESIRRFMDRAATRKPPGGPAIVLAGGGASKYQIVAPANEAELADAVADLRRAIKAVTGAELPVVAEAPAGGGPVIRIQRISAPAGWPHPDACRLRTEGENILIEATTPDGLRNGVYTLLTDHLDCHWFMPKQLGEELPVPGDKTLRVARVDETKAPSFLSSASLSWGSAPKWDRQNRSLVNRGRMNFGHAWQGLVESAKYPYDKFSDMWARDRDGKVLVFDHGWSWTNFCSTSPEVIQIVAEKINAQFDANPEALVASLDPNDLAPLCQCDRCLAVDAKYGVKPEDDKQMADRLIHFTGEIHDRLKPEHRGKFLGVLAYGFQTRPPKQAVPIPQFATTVCQFPSYFDHTRPFNDPTSPYNRDFHEIVKGWGSRVKQLGFYDYYGHYNFFGPWGILQKIREDLPAFKEMGGTFVVIESQPNFAMHGLNLYVAARLVWDIDADVDAVVEEYVAKFYGPAAGPMREFFRAAERHYALTRPGVHAALRVGGDDGFWRETDEHLKRAEAAVANLPPADKRFADRIVFTRDGITFGKLMFELDAPEKDAAFLRQAKPEIDRLKAKYAAPSDEYWPTLTPSYFWPDIDAMLKKLEKPQG